MPTSHPEVKRDKKTVSQQIDEAGKESFPSSDPPFWTLGSSYERADDLTPGHRLGNMLFDEHRVIRRVVKALSEQIELLEANQSYDKPLLEKIGQFFLDYVDGCHYKKEDLLFAAMKKAEGGPTDYLLHDLHHEHEHGKVLHSDLVKLLKIETNFPREQLTTILKSMVNLHHNHASKEEEHIFPFIDKTLSTSEKDTLLKEFKQCEDNLGEKNLRAWVDFSETLNL